MSKTKQVMKPKPKNRNAKHQPMPKSKAKREARAKQTLENGPSPDPVMENPSILVDVEKATQHVRDAFQAVAKDPNLAASLSDARSVPRFSLGGELVNLEDVSSAQMDKMVDLEGRVHVRRGAGPTRTVPAHQLLAWFRGDKSVVKPRQTDLEGELLAEKNGTRHFVRKRKTHFFEGEKYEMSLTEGQLSKFRGDMMPGKRLRVIDQKMRLKKEIDEYPGDDDRGSEMGRLLAIILAGDEEEEEEE